MSERSIETRIAAMSLEERAGQIMVIGFHGTALAENPVADLVARRHIGNFILFARNVESLVQLRSLDAGLRALALQATGLPPFITIDQEGGMVTRIQRGGTFFPGAMAAAAAVAAAERTGLGFDDLRRLGACLGAELSTVGVNVNLAPVADVNSNPRNPVIGVRSYGEDPAFVTRCAEAMAAGLRDAGQLAVAKHFPGHGDTETDSHFGLPAITHGLDRLEQVELPPFRSLIAAGIPMVMTAHVLMAEAVGELAARLPEPLAGDELAAWKALPATLNPLILDGLLRRRLGFQGVVITDCLEMKAIADHYPDAAVQAVIAGADLVLMSATAAVQEAAHESLVQAVRDGRLSEARLNEAVARVLRLKAGLAAGSPREPAPAAAAVPEAHGALARRFSRAALTVLGPGAAPRLDGGPVLYVDVEPAVLNGADDALAPRTMAAALRRETARLPELSVMSLPMRPDDAQVEEVRRAARGRRVVFGAYNAAASPGQSTLVRELAGRPEGFALVAMRSPYDAALVPASVPVLLVYEYTPLSIDSAVRCLLGDLPALGRCPVTCGEPAAMPRRWNK